MLTRSCPSGGWKTRLGGRRESSGAGRSACLFLVPKLGLGTHDRETLFRVMLQGRNSDLFKRIRGNFDDVRLDFNSPQRRETEFRGVRSQTEFGNEGQSLFPRLPILLHHRDVLHKPVLSKLKPNLAILAMVDDPRPNVTQ